MDPIEGLTARLTITHADLLERFRDLELACGRVPDPLATEEDAARAIAFIVACQLHQKKAEAARKQEKMLFLRADGATDAFFKGRCERLNAALAPTVARLKAYRDQLAAAERQRHRDARERAADEPREPLAETEADRARAERLSQGEQSVSERHDVIEALQVAEAAERAEVARQMAPMPVEPTCIRGNDGAIAFLRRSWSFEVVDLDQVPREYMSLDVPVVRAAITQNGIRHIPGLRIFQAEGLRVRTTTSPRSHETRSQDEQAIERSKPADAANHQPSDQRPPAPRTPKHRGRIRSGPDPRLAVPIKPIWGDQRVLRYCRQAVASLQKDAAELAKFRAKNAAIEARLWRKLPRGMEEIEFLYGGSRMSPDAGEGTLK
jgi:hypothetical protein